MSLEVWQASVDKFNIPSGSPIDQFLKSQEEAILKGRAEYHSFISSENPIIILNGIDLDKGYVLINVYGPRPDENVKSESDPLIDFFMTARDHFYRWVDFYIDESGQPQYKRSIESDRNRVPSPSFRITGRFGDCEYKIDQNPTFPDDFAWQSGYDRNNLRVSLEKSNLDGTVQAELSAFYKAPNWSENRYHVYGDEEPETGRLQKVEFSSQFGHKRVSKYYEGLFPDMRESFFIDSLGRFGLSSDCTAEVTRLNESYSLTSRDGWSPDNIRCKFPSQIDLIQYEKVALERNSDWRRLIFEINGLFGIG